MVETREARDGSLETTKKEPSLAFLERFSFLHKFL